ncbi:hypothetical protein CROQUDRAFT_57492 [Cronartium quercuum f. sp. fusiforme G11]|uniref:ferric-chelate reductase (NADPH) n=1 Tax=Cronartium quercuum f. sp. fusiforme G11 TaxID=708437 RepID=A0A9P6NWM9_9BASI|nr:hypothetical protein CROQUDRAFT_57492 [Cronartium quercuum f. sp. fusiforme G11]
MKNSPLSLVGKSYEKINLFHRFVGRIVTVLVTLHGALFLKMYLNGMIKNMLAMYSGVAMWLALVLMSITSLKPIRRRAYSLFYWIHLLGYLTIFGVGMVHSPFLRPYIGSAISLHLISLFWQAQKVKFENAILTALPGKYVMIEIVTLRSGWKAGQHVRIRFLGDLAHCFESHPFTIASHVGTHLVLYAKVVGSFTRTLYARAESTQNLGSVHVDFSGSPDVDKIHSQSSKDEEIGIRDKKELHNSGITEFTVKLSIQGPYGGMGSNSIREFGNVFLCVGGSGISYLTSTIFDLVTAKMNGKCSTKRIRALYVLREWDVAQYFGQLLKDQVERGTVCGIELELIFCITQKDITIQGDETLPGIHIYWYRPNIEEVLNEFLSKVTEKSGIGCSVCGPSRMVSDLRKAVGCISISEAKRVGGIVFNSAGSL